MTPEQLRRYRKAAGLTQDQLAADMIYDTATIGHWETGRRPIPLDAQKALVRYFKPLIDAKIREGLDYSTELFRLAATFKV